MPTEEQDHNQYIQSIQNTVLLNKEKMEKLREKYPEQFFLNVKLSLGIDKKATHRWNS